MTHEIKCYSMVHHICNFNMGFSEICHEMAQSIDHHECSKWNYLWLIPANLGASIFGIVDAPIAALVHLVAFCLFRIMECCTDDALDKLKMRIVANTLLGGAVSALTDNIITLFVRAGEMKSGPLTYTGTAVAEKLTVSHLEHERIYIDPSTISYENVLLHAALDDPFWQNQARHSLTSQQNVIPQNQQNFQAQSVPLDEEDPLADFVVHMSPPPLEHPEWGPGYSLRGL